MAKVEHAGGGSWSSLFGFRNMRLCRDAMPANGWITQIGVRLREKSAGSPATGTLVIYNDTSLAFESAQQSWGSFATYVASPSSAIRVNSGTNVNWGYRTSDGSQAEESYLDNITGHYVRDYEFTGDIAPATLPLEDATQSNVGLFGYYEYTPNATPSTGTWRTPSADGTSVSPSPTLEGNLLHPAEDSALDYSTDYQVQIYVLSTGALTVDQVYATSSSERTNGYWTRQFTLSAGIQYGAKFRHMDSWGVWSAWSAERTFLTEGGPNIPAPESPTTKINVISGYSYSAGYSHPDALAANAAQVELYNSTGTSLLYDSGTVVVSVPSGSTVSVAEWHADLAWATGYQWRMRIRDTDNVWSQYSAKQSFTTNSPPNAPTNLSPSDEMYTPTLTLTATATDPDSDAITDAEVEIVNADTNVVLTGYPKNTLETISGSTVTFTIPSGDVTLGTRYKWRARASDGHPNSPGAWSSYAFYRYQNVPEVSVVVPDPVTTPGPTFTATYTHPDATARTHAKWVLQKLANGVYSTIYDTGWTANSGASPSDFTVSFPANTVRNNETYRLKVYARDTTGGEGETPYEVFTTDYTGPPTLTVNVASADTEKAEILLEWTPSTLTPAEFAGIEVRKSAPGEDTEIVHVSYDPAFSSYRYPFPRSNVAYTLEVRQVKNVGVEQVEGDWAVSTVTVDYAPYSFLKDADDPHAYYAAFDTTIENLGVIEEDAPLSSVLPWGQSAYSHDYGEADLRSGEAVCEFHPDALNVDSAQTRYDRVRTVMGRKRAICLLMQLPDTEKMFIARVGPYQRAMLNVVAKSIRFAWQETLWSESFYDRNGA